MVCLSLALAAGAQESGELKFQNLSLHDGLSQLAVLSIRQDHYGFIWFGTTAGLHRYDGYGFTLYRSHAVEANSLSEDWITSIYEDRLGVLWIGTTSGVLSRFDRERQNLTHYDLRKHAVEANTPDEVPAITPVVYSFFTPATITAITAGPHADRDSSLWIGTWGHGIYKLTGSAVPPPAAEHLKPIPSANSFAHQEAWSIVHYRHDPSNPNSVSSNNISALYEDASGTLWIGTFGGGVNHFNETTASFIRYQHHPSKPNSLSDDHVSSIAVDQSGALWIGTFGGGLNKLVFHPSNAPACMASTRHDQSLTHEPDLVNFFHYRHAPSDPQSLSDDDVTAILEDSNGTLWVGTWGGGLNRRDGEREKFTHYKVEPQKPNSLNDDDVLALYEDDSGMLWVGTYAGGGLSKFTRQAKAFRHYLHNSSDTYGLSDHVVTSIYAETDPSGAKSNILWIGTRRGGLFRFDRTRNQFIHYQHDPADAHSLSQNRISAICGDGSGALWIGTHAEGLNKLETKSARVRRYQHNPADPNSLSNDQISALHQDKSGALWIGTFGGGIDKLAKGKDELIHYQHDPRDEHSLSDNRVSCIYEDRRGILWIGTFGGGLNQLVLSTGGPAKAYDLGSKPEHESASFIRYQHLPLDSAGLSDNHVLCICEDGSGMLWIGTLQGGLNKLDRKRGRFERFTEKDGLPSDLIYGILADDSGNLWLSTNRGLAKFNPLSRVCKTYDEHDGLQSPNFSYGAYYKSPAARGEMFFGSANGLCCFWPDSVKDSAYIPPLVITAFKKFGQPLKAIDGEFILSHKDNLFSIEFAALDYTSPERNQYAYRLEGFDEEWIYCGTRRFASYTNLNPGQYVFRVKGSNHDGIWNETGAAVHITIRPPFWKTWWFLALSLMGIVFAMALLHEHRVKQRIRSFWQAEQARKQENEQIRKQIARDFHDEFGHKLTNISLFTEILKQSLHATSPQDIRYLNKISDASRSLSTGIRDFIWTLDPQKDSLYDVAIRLKDFGDALYATTGIDFHAKGIDKKYEEIGMSMAWRRYLTLIFKESMSYLAHQPECKNVTLEIACEQKNVALALSYVAANLDDGPDHLTHWDEMKKYAHEIGGELIIMSDPKGENRMLFLGKIP